ncbi:MAG: draG [Clostridiales bacterium]|nr:draG [Clostridiales bacterium]
MKRTQDFFRGCLIGGAIGDALGWPVEFLKYESILSRYGKDGILDLVLSQNENAEVTDDTQMTLFTAEGILRAETRINEKEICDPPSVVYFAYLRWLNTQDYPKIKEFDWIYDGWLLNVRDLHNSRAPGNSCLSALLSEKLGTIDEPINNSKGCGGVMRVAPAGLFYSKEEVFQMAAEFAALTHGHPSGYLSAGALALIIACIINGEDIESAANSGLTELSKHEGHEECSKSLKEAIDLSHMDMKPLDAIKKLGEGWVGEEALAISVYCALKYRNDFKLALITAVNHNGDSDSTGAITGNILGAYLGVNSIPRDWIEKVELKDEIIQVADDLLTRYEVGKKWWDRYPGY